MAKAKALDEAKLIEALQNLLNGQPMRLTGNAKTPGIFPGGKTGEPLLKHALEQGYIQECAGPPAPTPARKSSSKTAADVRYARLTPLGQQWVLDKISPREALKALKNAFDNQCTAFHSEESEVRVLQTQVASLQATFEQVQQTVRDVSTQRSDDVSRLLATVQAVSDTFPRLTDACQSSASPQKSGSATPGLDTKAETFVRDWQRLKGASCPFHELYAALVAIAPDLTIGGFHDLLRSLHASGRARLVVWSAPPDRMKQPELGLFLSSTLMYYATVQ